MNYEVVLTSKASLQLSQAALWWSENRSEQQAALWLEGFQSAIKRLATNPERYGKARESDQYEFAFPVRQLLYGLSNKPTHRALFQIRANTVYVVAIRHLAERDVTPGDI